MTIQDNTIIHPLPTDELLMVVHQKKKHLSAINIIMPSPDSCVF